MLQKVFRLLFPSIALLQNATVYINDTDYENGVYGSSPTQSFITQPNFKPPAVNIRVNHADQVADGYWFLSVVSAESQRAPVILDTDGNLVYHGGVGFTTGFTVQKLNNAPVLSHYTGSFYSGGYGFGSYPIYDSHYNLLKTVEVKNLGGANRSDLHEMVITSNNTFLLSGWNVTKADLSDVQGPQDGYTFDCIFQELDSDNNVLFQWRSLDHVPVAETYLTPRDNAGNSTENPFDYCHLNSLHKDDDGGYLVSLRGTSSIFKINSDGSVAWRLHGKASNFTFGPRAEFWFQHHARWLNDSSVNPRYLSLFDNGGRAGTELEPQARGLILAIDQEAWTATLAAEYNATTGAISLSQGDTQVLSNTNVVVGLGAQPVYTEYSANGTVLYDVHFAALNNTSTQSYRAFKHPWIGTPKTRPAVAISDSKLFASWNGATEYTQWAVLSGDSVDTLSSQRFARTGFESNVTLPDGTLVGAAALDAKGACLGVSLLYYSANSTASGDVIDCSSIQVGRALMA